MTSETLTCVTTMTLLAALAAPIRLAAQSETGLASLRPDAQAGISAQLAKLTASDGAAFDYLGWTVAASGDTVAVGTWLAKIGSNYEQGAVYVFVKPASGWANLTQAAKLTASDGAAGDRLGGSVSISGNTVVSGAYGATIGSNYGQGAVYVFVKPAAGWANMTETAKLTASDGAALDILGLSVAIDGNTVATGEPGPLLASGVNAGQAAAYVFVKPASGWTNMTETAELTASDGVLSDEFGYSVSVSGNTVVVGARSATISGSNQFQGAAYVFVAPPGGWANMTETAKLTASDGVYADYLGTSVSISGSTIVAGAPGRGSSRGAAYVFVEPASGWANITETAQLSSGVFGDLLGYSVAMNGKTVVAGAPRWPAYNGPGAAYVFVEPPSGWKSTSNFNTKLTAAGGAVNDYLGYSVAISGNTVVSGAYGATIGTHSQQGAAYVFGGAHLLDALASQVQQAAQEQPQEHTRYKLVDLGTLGGPQGYFDVFFPPAQDLNIRGIAAGYADTPTPDPFPSACFNPDCFASHAFQWQNGVLTDLGALAAGWSSAPFWISDTGVIAGLSQNGIIDPFSGGPEVRAVYWKDGQIVDLGTLGGNESLAIGVNSRGQIVGAATNAVPDPFSFFGGTQTRAFLWQNSVMQDLGTLGGPDAFGILVNEGGQIAGNSYTSYTPTSSGVPQNNSFLWENGKMIDLGTLGGTSGFPNALNNRGQVVGQSNLAGDMVFRPFIWDGGMLTDLGTFLGPGPPSYGAANWINDVGETVGWADNQYNDFAALWKDGVIHNLGSVAGDCYAHANNINSNGQVVGGSGICNVAFVHAFLWENGGPILDLNTLVSSGSGVHLTNAVSINDRGEIASEGLIPNGDQHTFLLIPCGDGDAACGDGADSATTQTSPALVAQPRTIAAPGNPALGGRGMLDRFRARGFPGRRSVGPADRRSNSSIFD